MIGTLEAAGTDLTTVAALMAGDLVTVSGAGTVANKNVAANKAVTNATLALASADAGNYNLLVAGNTLSITPLALTGSITAANKVYDASNAATIAGRALAGVLGTDAVSYSGGTALFSDKNVANAKTVTGTGLSLAGADAGNYTVNTTATTTANITPASLTVTASNVTKTYGQTPTLSAFTTAGLVNSETIGSVTEISPGTVASASVAGSPYAITPSAATGGTFTPSNYTITYVDGALLVIPAAVPPIVVPPVVVVPPVEPPVVVVPPIVVVPSAPPPDMVAPEMPPVQDRLNLTVVGAGVRMPPIQLAETPPVQTGAVGTAVETPAVEPAPVIVPAEAPPQPSLRRDRN